VLEESGRIVGMVTDRDLYIALATRNRSASELLLGEIVYRELCVCAPDDDVRNALEVMAQRRIRRLPVVEQSGALIGILSLTDVVRQIKLENNRALKDDVIRVLKAICAYGQSDRSESAAA
jgi:CBS-domain-containing membrane protein